MIQVLVVHNSTYSNKVFHEKLIAKYPHFEDHENWRATVVRLGKKYPKKKYDRIYYHADTIDIADLKDYLLKNNRVTGTYGFTLVKEHRKLSTRIPTKVKKMWIEEN